MATPEIVDPEATAANRASGYQGSFLLREWAYGPAFPSSAYRTAALERWLHYYNWHRRHRGLGDNPPISRLVSRDDLLRHHS